MQLVEVVLRLGSFGKLMLKTFALRETSGHLLKRRVRHCCTGRLEVHRRIRSLALGNQAQLIVALRGAKRDRSTLPNDFRNECGETCEHLVVGTQQPSDVDASVQLN